MSLSRRDYLQLVAGAVAGGSVRLTAKADESPGIPGPYRGKVVGVSHSKCVRGGDYQPKPIREMLNRCMCELTGASNPSDAWRRFFTPGDLVGIKVNPTMPRRCQATALDITLWRWAIAIAMCSRNRPIFERHRGSFQIAGYYIPPLTQLILSIPAPRRLKL